jgi:GTP-binding protein
VLIGELNDAVVFDWDPTLAVGRGHAPGPRGSDWRIEG